MNDIYGLFVTFLGSSVTKVYALYLVGYPQLPEPGSIPSGSRRPNSHICALTDVKPNQPINFISIVTTVLANLLFCYFAVVTVLDKKQ
jgi:hypothetical protein